MKSATIYALLLLLIAAQESGAQKLPDDRMRDAEVHVGVGFIKLYHIGGRFRLNPFWTLETDVGYLPYSKPTSTFSIGFTAVPRPAQRNPGFVYTLLYTFNYRDEIDNYSGDNRTGFKHFVTANIGWVTQHSSGLSFLARIGGGLSFDDYRWRSSDGGGIFNSDEVHPWPNLELTIGYAF